MTGAPASSLVSDVDEGDEAASSGGFPRAAPLPMGARPDRQRRALTISALLYVALTVAFLATASRTVLTTHTAYDHYALLADAWLHGRLDLGGPPPGYTQNNDFAQVGGKYYVSFPPFPAVLLLPLCALAKDPAKVRDGLFFIGLAGIGPALLFLVLEKLRRAGRSAQSELTNAGLCVMLGLGTVYWFSAVQGTVWFAAHVVAMALLALFLWCSIDARHPWLAGLVLGLAFATRPPLLLAFPFFAHELWRAYAPGHAASEVGVDPPRASAPRWRGVALRALAFALPLALVLLVLAWHNDARFGSPTEFGHRLLQIAWRKRIEHWGLFSYHYLGRNLGIVLTSLPFHSAEQGWQVNAHGLALWVTTPAFLWVLWPRRTSSTFWVVAACAAAMALMVLLYQNSGWIQFGYRFSNDFSPLLVLALALGGRRLGAPFWLAVAFGIVVNGFGAVTFDRAEYSRFYFVDRTQRILHQPD